MVEIFEIEAKSALRRQGKKLVHGGRENRRIAQSRRAHHLPLIVVRTIAQVFGDGRIEGAQGMGKVIAAQDLDLRAVGVGPDRGGAFAIAIADQDGGGIKTRGEKTARGVGKVVIHIVKIGFLTIFPRKALFGP